LPIKDSVDQALKDVDQPEATETGDHASLSLSLHEFKKLLSKNGNGKWPPNVYEIIIGILVLIIGGFIAYYFNLMNTKIEKIELWQHNVNTFITENKMEIKQIKRDIVKQGVKLLTLDGTENYGRVVFYSKGNPTGYQPNERICSLSTIYDWKCDRNVLMGYRRKYVLVSLEGNFDNFLSFKVVGFFRGGNDGRMVQMTRNSLIGLVGKEKEQKYFEKGVLYGRVIFPKQ